MNSVVIPARPAASPPDAHQVKISRFPAAGAAGAVDATSATAASATTSFDFFSIYIHSLRR
ncbi:unannotated protein [freshwater metagenome]|uniref:Unannotated protein n=1 Tax=freshwater metagenome TaxID=449393 RepID=A0A6J6TMT5_9ZZZZ